MMEEPGRLQSMGSQRVRHDWVTSLIGNYRASQVALVVKNLPVNAGDIRDQGSIPRLGRSPGRGNGNLLQYSCWRIPWTEERGGLQSIRLQRVGNNWSDLVRTRTGNYSQYLVITCNGNNLKKHITESLCCACETNSILQTISTSIFKNAALGLNAPS